MEPNCQLATLKELRSSYKGPMKNGRMAGYGEYTFPMGAKFLGKVVDGMFQGRGVLHYDNGCSYVASWDKGFALEGTFTFTDGLVYKEQDWDYCIGEDRRFNSERIHGLKPAGESQRTDREPINLPDGFYDCGDDLYDPDLRVVTITTGRFLRNADPREHEWIIRHCRKAWDEVSGPKPENTQK